MPAKNNLKKYKYKKPAKKVTFKTKLANLYGKTNKKLLIVVGVLLFASVGYLVYNSSRAGTLSQYAVGVIKGTDGEKFDTRKFKPQAAPQLYLAQCDKKEACNYRFYIVPPKIAAGKSWTKYVVTSPDDKSYSKTVTSKTAVNSAFDSLVTSNKNLQKKRYTVKFYKTGGSSAKSNNVYMPIYVKPKASVKPTPTKKVKATPTKKVGATPTKKVKATPIATVRPIDENTPVDTADSEAGYDNTVLTEEEFSLELGDLAEFGLQESDLSSIAEEIVAESEAIDVSAASSPTDSEDTQKTLSDYGYGAKIFCVNKITGTTETYKAVNCAEASHLFLGVSGEDQAITKDQLTYQVKISGTKTKLADASGCTLKTLRVNKTNVDWCAVTYKEKSFFTSVRDTVQSRFKKIISAATRNKYVDTKDAKAYKLRAEKASIATKNYTITAVYPDYQPTKIGSGKLKFDVDETQTEKLIVTFQKADCGKTGGTFKSNKCYLPVVTASGSTGWVEASSGSNGSSGGTINAGSTSDTTTTSTTRHISDTGSSSISCSKGTRKVILNIKTGLSRCVRDYDVGYNRAAQTATAVSAKASSDCANLKSSAYSRCHGVSMAKTAGKYVVSGYVKNINTAINLGSKATNAAKKVTTTQLTVAKKLNNINQKYNPVNIIGRAIWGR